jgi:hypothetical protein
MPRRGAQSGPSPGRDQELRRHGRDQRDAGTRDVIAGTCNMIASTCNTIMAGARKVIMVLMVQVGRGG